MNKVPLTSTNPGDMRTPLNEIRRRKTSTNVITCPFCSNKFKIDQIEPENPPNIIASKTDEETVDYDKLLKEVCFEIFQLNKKRKLAANDVTSPIIIKPKPTGLFKVKLPTKKVYCPKGNKKLATHKIQKHVDVWKTGKNSPVVSQKQSEINNVLPQCSSTVKLKSTIETVNSCSGCNKKIESDQIEVHEDGLNKKEEEDILKVLPGSENIELLTCEICDRYFSVEDYEFHVIECISAAI